MHSVQHVQGGLPGLLMRLRQDGHESVGLIGPAGTRDAGSCLDPDKCASPAHTLSAGLLAYVSNLGESIAWRHPQVLVSELQPHQAPLVFKVACQTDAHAHAHALTSRARCTAYHTAQNPELEIVALTADHAAARQHRQQYPWAAPAPSATAVGAGPREICLELQTSGSGSETSSSSSTTSDSTQMGEISPVASLQPGALAARSFLGSADQLHSAECRSVQHVGRPATPAPAGKRRKLGHDREQIPAPQVRLPSRTIQSCHCSAHHCVLLSRKTACLTSWSRAAPTLCTASAHLQQVRDTLGPHMLYLCTGLLADAEHRPRACPVCPDPCVHRSRCNSCCRYAGAAGLRLPHAWQWPDPGSGAVPLCGGPPLPAAPPLHGTRCCQCPPRVRLLLRFCC